MFRKFVYFLLLLPVAASSQIPLGIGEWRTHVPYRNATSITDAGDRIYVSTNNIFFFSYDKSTGSLQRYDKVSGLSDVGVSFVEYNPFNATLLIAYDNTNIDLIRNNTILNISDIKRKQIAGEKKINSVFFLGNLAYLSCSFGIVTLDMDKKEIKDTYYIGSNGSSMPVFSFTADSSRFYAATGEGLKTADRNASNLANYNEWVTEFGFTDSSFNVVSFNGKIFLNEMDTLYEYDGINWNYYYSQPLWKIINLVANESHLFICEGSKTTAYDGRIGIVDTDFVCCNYNNDSQITVPNDAMMNTDGILWVADFLNGLLKISDNQIQSISPNGPGTNRVQNLSVERGKLWVAPGGGGPTIGCNYNGDGVFTFSENWWNTYNLYTNQELANFFCNYETAAHPSLDKVYFGSWWGGLAEYANGSFTVYDKDNSTLGASADPNATIISGLSFDSNENLWMTSFSADSPIVVKKADGTWKSFAISGIDENGLTQIIVDDYNQKWMTIPKSNNQGILVFKEADENNSNNLYKILRSGQGSGNLPTNEVLCLAKDLQGEIWAGTAQGIAVFYCPSAVLAQDGCDAQQIIVTVNGVAGYLLETERVNTLAIDGANRKWVGTNNGVFVLSPDGTQQVDYYTVDNSPLLSNSITDIAIDQQSGEVFIGTDKGLTSIRGEATAGGESHSNVLVFPNPVRENYEGPIAIKGLANNANIKITDVNGVLFYETTSFGGQAVWDGRNYNGDRAKTGVYFIFSSNEDGSSKNVAKVLIVN